MEKLLGHLSEVKLLRDARQMETLDILRDILINIRNETEAARNTDKNDKQVVPDSSTRMTQTALNETEKLTSRAESPRKLRTISNATKSPKYRENSFDFAANRDMGESVRSEMPSEATRSNNGSKADPYSEDESLRQISDIRSDEGSRHLSARSAFVKSVNKAKPDADMAVLMSGDEEDAKSDKCEDDARDGLANQGAEENVTAVDKMTDTRLSTLTEVAEETRRQETRDDVAPTNEEGSLAPSEVSEMKDRVQSDASSARSKAKVPKKSIIVVHSSAKEDAGSPPSTENDINSRHPVEKIIKQGLVKFCSSDSWRGCASLSSAKNNGSPLKGTALLKQISFNVEDNSGKDRDETGGGSSTTAIENGHYSGFLRSIEDDNEQLLIDATNTLRESKADRCRILSDSNSSIFLGSTLLDRSDR